MPRADRSQDGDERRAIRDSARAFLRAAAGGLLVGLPLLWTMEMWERGSTMPPFKLLVLLGVAFAVVVGFNAISGFRRDRTWQQLLIDALEGTGLSVVIAAGMLFLLGRLEPEEGLSTLVGRIALLSIPVAFGTAIASTVLSEPDSASGGDPTGPIGRLLVAAGGALYFALNVAPTDEVRLIGSQADAPLLLLVIAASLLISLAIVFVVEWPGGRRAPVTGSFRERPLAHPFGETVAAYVVALLVSLLLILALEQSDGLGPRALVGHVVMLGTIASFGSAAGRLLLTGTSGASDGGGA